MAQTVYKSPGDLGDLPFSGKRVRSDTRDGSLSVTVADVTTRPLREESTFDLVSYITRGDVGPPLLCVGTVSKGT